LRGTLQRPTTAGGANWGGSGLDPETGLLYLRTSEGTSSNQVCKNDGSAPDLDVDYSNNCEYGAANNIFQGHDGGPIKRATSEGTPGSKLGPIPLIKPPYATLVAVNLHKGEIAWRVPFGEGSPAIRRHPLLKGVALPDRLGTPGPNSVLVTKSGLVLIGGGDPYLYAFDKVTGKELWRVATPRQTAANPMTYRARSGRQFVLIAGGAGPDAILTAFALGTGDRPTTTTRAPAAPVPAGSNAAAAAAQARSGEEAFRAVCQSCHGVSGRGGIAPPLVPLSRGADEVTAIVREGTGQMPPVSSTELSDAEVTRIVEHLRSLR
jgi:quinoprotein glucose dehydrogenase